MEIKHLAGSFGRLTGEVLEPGPGLNIIEAPNESGKSTWAALLRVMLYGLSTRDRAADADKRRYFPWCGAPMEGTLSLSTAKGDITITRRTDRPGSPMGGFSAVYTGTAQPVPGLSGENCGEVLLGVPQEVYRRTAFIQSAGIAVDQSPALEQRIASLLSSGEEDTSYADAAGRLHKQLNHRRSSRSTGQLPQIEAQEAQLREELHSAKELEQEIQAVQEALTAAEGRVHSLEDSFSLRTAAGEDDAASREAQLALETARREAEGLAQKLRGLPSREELLAIRQELLALDAARDTLYEIEQQAEAAAQRMAAAEDAAQAEKGSSRPLMLAIPVLVSLLLGVLIWISAKDLFAAAAGGLGSFGLAAILLFSPLSPLQKRQKKRGETAYADAAAGWREVNALQRRLTDTYTEQKSAVLEKLRALCPKADEEAARAAVSGALSLWDSLEAARQRVKDETLRAELARGSRPALSPQEEEQLREAREQVQALRQRLHTAQGRQEVSGSSDELALRLRELAGKRQELEEDYAALSLAAQVLAEADDRLKRRFSPALGASATKLFAKLTKEKYNSVLLDSGLHPSAKEAGQLSPREALFLSQGTADQLYLAVRLALCETVLPQEDPAPLLLDDALMSFDDDRCAAALELLWELSQKRQILLFTCQSREAQYLSKAHPDTFCQVTF